MPTEQQLRDGLRKAHNAGDARAAKLFATQLSQLSAEPNAQSNDLGMALGGAGLPGRGNYATGGAPENPVPMTAARFAANPAIRALTGAGDMLHGPLRLGAYAGDKVVEGFGGEPMLGDWLDKNRAQLKDMQARGGHEGFDAAGLLGGLATGVGGIAALPAATSKIPLAAKIGKALAPAGPGAGVASKIGQGAKTGAFFGASAPASNIDGDYLETKAAQTVGGAALGAILPGAVELGKKGASVVKDISRTFTQSGKYKLAEDYIRSLAGDSRQKIVDALANVQAKAHGALPGAKPATGGQAIAEANISAGERFGGPLVKLESALARAPEATTGLRSTQVGQENARKAVIDAIAKTPADRAAAVTARKTASEPLYEEARQTAGKVDIAPVRALVKDFFAKNKNESDITKPLAEIAKKLKDTSPQSMMSLSRDIKRMIGMKNPATGQSEFNVKALTAVKKSLDDQISVSAPTYSAARETTKELSKPINRMDVGTVLKDKLANAKDSETAMQFLKALDDVPKTMKKATGFPRYNNLEQVLQPAEAAGARGVGRELLRDNMAKRMSREVDLPGALVQESSGAPQLPNALWRPAMIANYMLRTLGTNANTEVNQAAAKILADPALLQKTLTLPAANAQRKAVEELMQRILTQQAPAQSLGAGLGEYYGP